MDQWKDIRSLHNITGNGGERGKSLQQLQKWLRPQRNIVVDDLEVIKDDNQLPTQWKFVTGVTLVNHWEDNLVKTTGIRVVMDARANPVKIHTLESPVHRLVIPLRSNDG